MLYTMVMLAALAAPPEGVDPMDLDRWEAGAAALLDGPQRCWDLDGTLRLTIAIYTPPSMFTRAEEHEYVLSGTFDGRISQGRWESFRYRAKAEQDAVVQPGFEMPVFPLVGEIDQAVVRSIDDEGNEHPVVGEDLEEGSTEVSVGTGGASVTQGPSDAMNLLDKVLEEIDPVATTSIAEWRDDPAGITLIQDAPLTDRPRSDTLTLTTFFPDGDDHATRLDVEFPKRQKVGDGLVKLTIIDPQFHLRGQEVAGDVLPALESTSAVFGLLGFTVGYEQKLSYTAAEPCVSESSELPPE
jgi:hypothetical protein